MAAERKHRVIDTDTAAASRAWPGGLASGPVVRKFSPSHQASERSGARLASTSGNNKHALTLRSAGAGAHDDATAVGTRFGFRVRSFVDGIRVIGGQRDSKVCVENTVTVGGAATPGTYTTLSFRDPAPTPTRFERPTDRRLPPTVHYDMRVRHG